MPATHPVTPALCTLLATLTGCGANATPRATATAASEPEAEQGSRSFGPSCTVSYEAGDDITIVVMPWAAGQALAFVLPGDGWEGTCGSEDGALVSARQPRHSRNATVTLDPNAVGDVDVEAYARDQVAHALSGLRAQGLEVQASPLEHLGDGLYVVAFRVTTPEGNTLLHVNAHHVIATPHGLLRYHLSELGEDPRTLNLHAALLANAVRAFALTSP